MQPSYDAAGNVSSVTTTLAAVGTTPGGSETQAFCYDELDRLTWAGTSGTGPCGRAGSEGISGAGYTASYAYDTFDRLTSASVLNSSGVALPGAAQGGYTYGASGHLHAVSAVGTGSTGYSAAYDAAGELTCRAVGASTCTNATPTGQALGYDALRRLISWQDASTSPTATGAYAYDGSGSRVWQQDTSTNGGVTTTTTTTYILGMAEITSTQTGQAATSTTATRFYPLAGGVSALRDAAGLSYVASDQLGTPIATLNLDTGAVLGEQLRAPYGQARYAASAPTNGGMRTTYGFTGQREDASAAGSSGLAYFNVRYYDPVVGRFTSPDSIIGADPLLDGYAYVGGMVESATDPSGFSPIPPIPPIAPGSRIGQSRRQAGSSLHDYSWPYIPSSFLPKFPPTLYPMSPRQSDRSTLVHEPEKTTLGSSSTEGCPTGWTALMTRTSNLRVHRISRHRTRVTSRVGPRSRDVAVTL